MEYYDLDPVLQAQFTPKEWMWLSDKEKADILNNETEPDYEEDLADGS